MQGVSRETTGCPKVWIILSFTYDFANSIKVFRDLLNNHPGIDCKWSEIVRMNIDGVYTPALPCCCSQPDHTWRSCQKRPGSEADPEWGEANQRAEFAPSKHTFLLLQNPTMEQANLVLRSNWIQNPYNYCSRSQLTVKKAVLTSRLENSMWGRLPSARYIT